MFTCRSWSYGLRDGSRWLFAVFHLFGRWSAGIAAGAASWRWWRDFFFHSTTHGERGRSHFIKSIFSRRRCAIGCGTRRSAVFTGVVNYQILVTLLTITLLFKKRNQLSNFCKKEILEHFILLQVKLKKKIVWINIFLRFQKSLGACMISL